MATIRLPRIDMRPPCSVGLDRIDFGAATARDVGRDNAEQQASDTRRDERMKRIEGSSAPQALTGIKSEKNLVHISDCTTHGDDNQACNGTDDHRQHNDARFACSHDGAQAMRNFKRSAEPMHGGEFKSDGNATA
jgi:hypothetical protein